MFAFLFNLTLPALFKMVCFMIMHNLLDMLSASKHKY